MPEIKKFTGRVVESSDATFPERRLDHVTHKMVPTGKKIEQWRLVLQVAPDQYQPVRIGKYKADQVPNPLYPVACAVQEGEFITVTVEGVWNDYENKMDFRRVSEIEDAE